MYGREKPHTKFDCKLKEEIRTIPVFFFRHNRWGGGFTNILKGTYLVQTTAFVKTRANHSKKNHLNSPKNRTHR